MLCWCYEIDVVYRSFHGYPSLVGEVECLADFVDRLSGLVDFAISS